jgi:hypothetical protein
MKKAALKQAYGVPRLRSPLFIGALTVTAALGVVGGVLKLEHRRDPVTCFGGTTTVDCEFGLRRDNPCLAERGQPNPRPSAVSRLTIVEREGRSPDGRIYIEGALQVVALTATDGSRSIDWPLCTRRTSRLVPAGEYRLTSATRACSGDCRRLDRGTDRCDARLSLRAGQHRRVTVLTQVGRRCAIAVD